MRRRLAAEFVGTAFLLMGIVGSGAMAQRLTVDPGLQLLQNALATGAVLAVMILVVGPVSGAHLNPVVTVVDRVFGGLTTGATFGYVLAQVSGGVCGVMVANLMFDLPAVSIATTVRDGSHLWLADMVATVGLVVVVFGLARTRQTGVIAFAVGLYITSAFYFTSSTSFANPAVTAARTLSDTFAGIAPNSAPGFVAAQIVGATVAIPLIRLLYPDAARVAADVTVPHPTGDEA